MNIWPRIVLIVSLLLFLAPLLLGWITPAEFFTEYKRFVVERILL